MIKICHVISSLERRGAQVFAKDLIENLSKYTDIKQTILVLRKVPQSIDIGIEDDSIVVFQSSNPVKVLWYLFFEIKKVSPDIMFAHGGEPLKYLSFLKMLGLPGKILYRKIGLSEKWIRHPKRLRMMLQRRFLNICWHISAVGENAKRELVELFRVDEQKVSVVYRGTDPNRFEVAPDTRRNFRKIFEIESKALVMVSVGALSWEKNLDAMLRCFSEIKSLDGNNVYLLIAGSGDQRNHLAQLSEDLEISDRVKFLGAIKDIPSLLAASDVLLLTSLTEGVPGVLIEAGLAGLACISWDVAGANEVVVDEKTGFITPFLDEETFRKRLQFVVDNREILQRQGECAKKICRSRFNISSSTSKHYQIIKQAINN